MNNLWILANVEGNETPLGGITSEPETETSTKTLSDSDTVATKGTEPKPFGNMVWVIWIALMLVMFFVVFRGPQKQKQERKKLVQSLQKNDRVQTIGGIFGTVVDIKGDEITLKIDESNNTKVKVASSAIGRNLSQDKS
jgi:preprotein translocase subunit YajC